MATFSVGESQMPEESEPTRAVRHVAEARRIVVRQRQRIETPEAAGDPTQQSEELLQTFESTLWCLEDHAPLLRVEQHGNTFLRGH